jgi:hypothetical protein
VSSLVVTGLLAIIFGLAFATDVRGISTTLAKWSHPPHWSRSVAAHKWGGIESVLMGLVFICGAVYRHLPPAVRPEDGLLFWMSLVLFAIGAVFSKLVIKGMLGSKDPW